MELQQLKYFREVAKREHVTRAAEKLFVSQSAISRAVTQLEEELGVPLFYRQGRAVVLSRYGSRLDVLRCTPLPRLRAG
jgi:DNA-binding transcriptional LysR family regulator